MLRRKVVASKCGHETQLKGRVTIFGQSIRGELRYKGIPEFCLNCLGGMAIRCAWCGQIIFTDNPVTLYSPRDQDFEIPAHAVVFSQEPLRLVGCLRSECAETAADLVGYWVPGDDGKGRVKRVPTIYERLVGQELSSTISQAAKSDPAHQESTRQIHLPGEG